MASTRLTYRVAKKLGSLSLANTHEPTIRQETRLAIARRHSGSHSPLRSKAHRTTHRAAPYYHDCAQHIPVCGLFVVYYEDNLKSALRVP